MTNIFASNLTSQISLSIKRFLQYAKVLKMLLISKLILRRCLDILTLVHQTGPSFAKINSKLLRFYLCSRKDS